MSRIVKILVLSALVAASAAQAAPTRTQARQCSGVVCLQSIPSLGVGF